MKKVRNGGFSIVELIFVLVILAIIISIVVATYPGLMHNMKIKADISSAKGIARAIRVGYLDYNSDDIIKPTFDQFIKDTKANEVTVKLSEFGIFEKYTSPETKPISLVNENDTPIGNQNFFVGFLESDGKMRVVVQIGVDEGIDLSTIDFNADSETIATYDGYESGVIFIDPKESE